MNCLLCLIEEGYDHPTVAICQQCGAGVCEKHLFLLKGSISPAGMAPVRTLRRLMCVECYHEAHPEVPTRSMTEGNGQAKQNTSSLVSWWKRLFHRGVEEKVSGIGGREKVAAGALPEPEEAVALIERFFQENQERRNK